MSHWDFGRPTGGQHDTQGPADPGYPPDDAWPSQDEDEWPAPDGSQAEMSGNGTRIAARWLAEQTGNTEVTVVVGDRRVSARLIDDSLVEQDLDFAVHHGTNTILPPTST